MAELVVNADVGRELGSSASRRLRREGKIPGVIYGLEVEPTSVSVVYGELRQALSTDAGLNALINLDVAGDQQLSIVKDIQRHPFRDEVIHVDFIRIDPTAELEVEVPIVLEGDPKKVTDENGMVDQTMFALTVFSSPNSIPNELIIDISGLEINDAIRVADLALPPGVRTEVDGEDAVAIGTVTRSTMESMAAEEAAEAEGDEAVGGAEGGADGADAAGSDDSDD
jgi:large subunit ribosomal protein L25